MLNCALAHVVLAAIIDYGRDSEKELKTIKEDYRASDMVEILNWDKKYGKKFFFDNFKLRD